LAKSGQQSVFFFFFFFFFWSRRWLCHRHEQASVPAPHANKGTTCSLELSLPVPAGIFLRPHCLLEAPIQQHYASEVGSVGVTATGAWHLCRGIPTKPAGGLQSDIGKGATSLG